MILVSLLLMATSFVFAANNIGMIRSSFQEVHGRAAWGYLGVVVAGFTGGYLAEGYKVGSTVSSGLVRLTSYESAIALAVTLAVMAGFTFLRLPASISNVALGAIVGPAIALGEAVHWGGVYSILLAWLVAPVTAAVLAVLVYAVYLRCVSRWPLLTVARVNRFYGLATVAVTSYSLSANNLGMLLGFASGGLEVWSILVCAVLGSVLMSRLVASTLGWRVAVLSPAAYYSALLAGSVTLWIYTQFGVPASLTQTVVSAVLVLSLSRRPSVVKTRIIFEMLGSWPFFLTFTLAVSYGLALLL
ncbi:MAG: inorganic phosphate transporter [Nitrososphaerota archaeon]|nr:inorganic phosphate transporter [Nitrososphaerota archaeon]MDG6939717.1 inorganic phosphate transporter [Nitrososphaerota archaeon]